MSGFAHFLRKEAAEIMRTWRLPVVAGVVAFFAVSGPILALLTPQLLESMQSSQPGVVITVPDPTWRDAYVQWIKNLSQIVAFITIIASAGTVAGELSSGSGVLVLTKPVSRGGFVVAKCLAMIGLVTVTTLVGAGLTQAVTYAVFGEAPTESLWLSTALWLVFAALLISFTVLLSSTLPTLAAAGVGVGGFFAVSLAALWGPAVKYSPAGLSIAPAEVLAGKDPALMWPVVTTLLASVLLVVAAAWAFSRREI
jgi:ABC-2 type transport system permease protein